MVLRWDHAELALMPTGAAPSYKGPGLDISSPVSAGGL